jgi:tetratricopeptide (TPR) repeat protein
VYDTFDTPADLSARVVTALGRRLIREAQAGQRRSPDASGRLVDLVNMPRHGPLIGRAGPLSQLLTRLVAGDDVGVFAIEGMGGVGKTALAAEAAERLAADEAAFPGGVLWVACAGLEGETGLLALLTQVARALGHAEIAALTDLADVRRALAAALRNRPRTLLALDNVEPGLDVEATLQSLSMREHTTLLLTAREAVAPGQVSAIPLAPLPAPEASELFAQRLGQETNNTRPTAEEAGQIPALVEAVGGLPLAVELLAIDAAKQQTALVSLQGELAQAGINAAAFHADPRSSVTQVFDRSYLRLPSSEQRLFAGLGLLAEVGFPRPAAEALAVAAGEGDMSAPAPVDAVRSLVRAGLAEPLLGERLRLHPLLRAYARDKLAGMGQEAEDTLGNAMLAYWLAYAQAHPSQRGNDPAGMDAQEAEAAGFLAALEWAHERGHYRELLAVVHEINLTWAVRGRRAEERRFSPWAVTAARALGEKSELRFMLHELALLDSNTGRREEARAGYEEALRLARELGDRRAIQLETHELAALDGETGRREEALRLSRELQDRQAEADDLSDLANTLRQLGQSRQAREQLQESLAISQRISDPYQIGMTYTFLGRLDAQEGHQEEAIADYRLALQSLEPLQSPEAEEARSALRRLGAQP